MDLHCGSCFEPWEISAITDAITEGDPDFTLEGYKILSCPGCPRDGNTERPLKAILAAMVADLMPDDPDGQAAALEDLVFKKEERE